MKCPYQNKIDKALSTHLSSKYQLSNIKAKRLLQFMVTYNTSFEEVFVNLDKIESAIPVRTGTNDLFAYSLFYTIWLKWVDKVIHYTHNTAIEYNIPKADIEPFIEWLRTRTSPKLISISVLGFQVEGYNSKSDWRDRTGIGALQRGLYQFYKGQQ